MVATILSPTVPVCPDLLTIGAGTVVRKASSFTGYRAYAGLIQTGPVPIGSGALVVTSTHLVRAGLYLVISLGAIAGLYLVLGAELVARHRAQDRSRGRDRLLQGRGAHDQLLLVLGAGCRFLAKLAPPPRRVVEDEVGRVGPHRHGLTRQPLAVLGLGGAGAVPENAATVQITPEPVGLEGYSAGGR